MPFFTPEGLEHVVEENQLAGKVMRGINQERM
jgi:hypothetical protein